MKEIDKDLVRWNRSQWMAVVAGVVAIQIAALVWGSKAAPLRVVYPQETKVAFAEPVDGQADWIDLENPFLFASASQNGFSGEAWLPKPEWKPPVPMRRMPSRFLASPEASAMGAEPTAEARFALVERRQPRALFPPPPDFSPPDLPESQLRLEGFENRPLVRAIPLPRQYHNDILQNSVVETHVGRDGLVILARLIENSGSPKADADALALAKRAQFAPVKNGGPALQSGKLKFDWFALDLSHTNNVKR